MGLNSEFMFLVRKIKSAGVYNRALLFFGDIYITELRLESMQSTALIVISKYKKIHGTYKPTDS